ncbi:hypothetical protein M426DRAFT_9690 [Hypoxylon sp. CI-4A]|nr:hypothetical protein M426DRAFT_9690 [Hypoxylon sp. CI-4A]
MPPRRKVAAAQVPLPLDGCIIAISGTIPGNTQATIERDFIKVLGATPSKSVTSTTTHLVTTQADFNKPSIKVATTQTNNVTIVNFAWLEDSLKSMARMNEASYSFTASKSPTPTLKRAASQKPATDDDAGDGVNSQVQAKKKSKSSKVKVQEDEVEETKEPKIADGQIAKSRDVRIPLDEGAEHSLAAYEVYIDDDGVIYDASLNQTNASNNNNKFYRLQLLRSVRNQFKIWTRWGRVGERGQRKIIDTENLTGALSEFNDKFKSKSGLQWADRANPPKRGKYAFIERSYEPDSEDDDTKDTKGAIVKDEPQDEPLSTLPKATQELMQLIFNQQFFAATMADLNYDAAKLPLGKLSKSTITRGFQALRDLSDLLNDISLAQSKYDTDYTSATEYLSNLYFTLIPHAFGRNKPPIIRDSNLLKREIELLESLSDMKDASLLMKTESKEKSNILDQHFRSLGVKEMTPLDNTSSEFTQISDYLMNTRGSTHNANYQISQIFRIERQGEWDRFGAVHTVPRNRRLLWHGSRCTNFGGILSQGLRIAPPEAPATGYSMTYLPFDLHSMFGKGIYLADMSSKSANYCYSSISNGHALLLLCEAELGDPIQTLTSASYSAAEDAKAKGMLSTWGQGTTGPNQWKDAECVHPSLKGVQMPDTSIQPDRTGVPNAYLLYNEYICYDISQVRLRYLLRVRM